MGEILFASDLDNTLLFSCRYRQETDQCVELLDGKEQGFCTRRSLDLLAQVCQGALFIPVTTRSVAQYRRIDWPAACIPQYAVTTNGGILLDGGKPDPQWSEQTEQLAAPWRGELLEMQRRLESDPIPKRCRMVDGVYLYAACDSAEDAQAIQALCVGRTGAEIAVSGRKVYFFPPALSKGEALRRLNERFRPSRTICAGDSVIDLPMLRAADCAIVPEAGMLPECAGAVYSPGGAERFPEFVLQTALREISRSHGPAQR